ncbi:phage protein NinX family protein [Enterobacter ludwigii]|uniref:phage protein NinX family protein n=1 Tax=Enterobacter ludwigii TaxID=299767 RepID=UPI003BEF0AB5
MDYSQLSDFEINKHVAIALNIDMHFFISESEDSFDSEVLPSEIGPIWQTSAHMVLQYSPSNGNCFNPCNNPAYAWPIIESNHIAIHPLKSKGIWVALSHDHEYSNRDVNPLRAAMVTFLTWKGSFNA